MLLVTKKNGVAKQTMLHGQRDTILASKIFLVFPNLIVQSLLLIVFNIIFLFIMHVLIGFWCCFGLVFKYLKGQHNVYEVIENTFRSCNASNGGVLAKYESGEDQVVLNKVKKYWFICNIAGHCLGGMRFGIEVKDRNNATTNFMDGAAFNPQIQPTPSNNSCNSYYFISKRWRVIENLLPFGIGLLLLSSN